MGVGHHATHARREPEHRAAHPLSATASTTNGGMVESPFVVQYDGTPDRRHVKRKKKAVAIRAVRKLEKLGREGRRYGAPSSLDRADRTQRSGSARHSVHNRAMGLSPARRHRRAPARIAASNVPSEASTGGHAGHRAPLSTVVDRVLMAHGVLSPAAGRQGRGAGIPLPW